MSLGLSLSLKLCLTCDVCGQDRDEEKALAARTDVILYGQEPFATCPCCCQRVTNFKDTDYQLRARTYSEKGPEMSTDAFSPQKEDTWEDLDPRSKGRQIKILFIEGEFASCKRVDGTGPVTKIRLDRFRASRNGQGKKGFKLISSKPRMAMLPNTPSEGTVLDLNANLQAGVDLGT